MMIHSFRVYFFPTGNLDVAKKWIIEPFLFIGTMSRIMIGWKMTSRNTNQWMNPECSFSYFENFWYTVSQLAQNCWKPILLITYFYEIGFLSLVLIKTKARHRLIASVDVKLGYFRKKNLVSEASLKENNSKRDSVPVNFQQCVIFVCVFLKFTTKLK